jgi:hypothetical protein
MLFKYLFYSNTYFIQILIFFQILILFKYLFKSNTYFLDYSCRNRRRQKTRSIRQRRREDTANGPNSWKVNRRKVQWLLYR